jgi:hypothetical protein
MGYGWIRYPQAMAFFRVGARATTCERPGDNAGKVNALAAGDPRRGERDRPRPRFGGRTNCGLPHPRGVPAAAGSG